MKKIRRLGDITADLEPLILEMVVEHDMQWNEVMAIVHSYLQVHCPGAQETYTDGSHPEYYYGYKRKKKWDK